MSVLDQWQDRQKLLSEDSWSQFVGQSHELSNLSGGTAGFSPLDLETGKDVPDGAWEQFRGRLSFLEQMQDRKDFALYDHAQLFQTRLVFNRALFGALSNYPFTVISNNLLRPDLQARDENGKKIRKVKFDAAAWKFFDDVVTGAGGGQIARSFIFAYKNNKKFRDVHNAARALEGFCMAAETFDNGPQTLAQEIKAGRSHAVHQMVNHSAEASELLDQFVHNRLKLTPDNAAKLQRHLMAMAALCTETAELRKAYDQIRDPEARAKAEERGDSPGASGYIRDVIRLENITTPRQAQILSGFISALMVDAAKPLGTEMYIPQNQIYLGPRDVVELSQFVERQMQSRGYVPNVSLNQKERPFPDLPEGAVIRQVRHPQTGEVQGYEKLTEVEAMSFANAMHGYIRKELGGKVESMLVYVDKHFDAVENAISRSEEDPLPSPIRVWDKDRPAQTQGVHRFEDRVKSVWEKSQSLSPISMLHDAKKIAVTAVKHATRPEARYENSKLFWRALAAQLVSAPIKIIDEGVKSFLRPNKGYDYMMDALKKGKPVSAVFGPGKIYETENGKRIRGKDGKFLVKEELNPLFDSEDVKNNLKSNAFRLFSTTIASSIGTVGLQELYFLPKGLAVESSGRGRAILTSAIKTGHRHAPEVAQRMKAMQGAHPSMLALMQKDEYRNNMPRIAATKLEDRSEDDYRILASYYAELADITLNMAEEALSPYGVKVEPDKISSMDDIVARVLRKPVDNIADAMVSLAYAQTFMEVNAEKISSVEYVEPNQLLIKPKALRKLGNFIDSEARAAGLVAAKAGEVEGVDPGELLERDEEGKLKPASEETLVRYANKVTEELKKHVDIDNLLYAVKGKYKEDYLGKIEDQVFGEMQFQVADKQEAAPQEEVAAELTAKWAQKVKRNPNGLYKNIQENVAHPEVQHEIRKLLDRGKGLAVSSFFPGLIMNSLQHNEPVFKSRAGWYSAWFKTAVYPLLYSKGLVITKEAINESLFHRRHIINESNVAQSLIEGAIATSGMVNGELRDKMVEANQVHSDMMALQTKDEYKDIPRIAAKPRELRDDGDEELMQRFSKEVGEKMVENSSRIFSALGQGKAGESVEEVMARSLSKPVGNLNDAVITLGFIHSMLGANAHFLDVLTFVKPEDKVLSRGQLREMTEFMNQQAADAGFAIHGVAVQGKAESEFTLLGKDDSLKEGELMQWNEEKQEYARAPEEAIIRYANVVMEKFRELSKVRMAEDKQGLVEKYKLNAKEEIFKHLKKPTGKALKDMPQHEVDGRVSEMEANFRVTEGKDVPAAEKYQSRIINANSTGSSVGAPGSGR